jgi:ribonucleoside-diphosphate reductase alpha chain
LALRSGIKVEEVVEQLKGIGGEHPVFQQGALVLSIPDGIARILEKRYLSPKGKEKTNQRPHSMAGEKCPECGETVSFEEGCILCHFCGFAKCG